MNLLTLPLIATIDFFLFHALIVTALASLTFASALSTLVIAIAKKGEVGRHVDVLLFLGKLTIIMTVSFIIHTFIKLIVPGGTI